MGGNWFPWFVFFIIIVNGIHVRVLSIKTIFCVIHDVVQCLDLDREIEVQ